MIRTVRPLLLIDSAKGMVSGAYRNPWTGEIIRLTKSDAITAEEARKRSEEAIAKLLRHVARNTVDTQENK